MRSRLPACLIMCLPLVSCVEMTNPLDSKYAEQYKPASVVHRGNLCDVTYEVKTRRGAVHFVHNGLREAHAPRNAHEFVSSKLTENKPYHVRLTNHGSDFQVSSGTPEDHSGHTRIPAGKTVILPMKHGQTGFAATNQREQPRVPGWQPVHASVTFLGIPAEMEKTDLIELYTGGF